MNASCSKYPLLIINAGKFGREMLGWVYDSIKAGAALEFKGFLDDREDILAKYGYDEPIIGSVETYRPSPDERFLCAVGDIGQRQRYADIVRKRFGAFASLIHPTAVIGRNVEIGEGSVVGPFANVGADVTIGACSVIGPHCCVSHDSRVGDYSHLTAHCVTGGNVTIEDHCFLGLGCVVVPNVTLRAHAFVGAGSVVLADVPPFTKVFGNPAVMVGKVSPAVVAREAVLQQP